MERTILHYITRDGRRPFEEWRDALHGQAALKVTVALARLADGNDSNVKSLGGGLAELKIHFGPGYRVYFGNDGAATVILLGGGTKASQSRDIAQARTSWADYKQRKKGRP